VTTPQMSIFFVCFIHIYDNILTRKCLAFFDIFVNIKQNNKTAANNHSIKAVFVAVLGFKLLRRCAKLYR